MLRGIFITGTGTGVGKSVVTAALTRALFNLSCPCLAIKPIQTGTIKHGSISNNTNNIALPQGDENTYLEALTTLNFEIPNTLKPQTLHHFALPASPHLAAHHENITLNTNDICAEINQCAQLAAYNPLIIEGAGGAYVPINDEETSLDLMQKLNLPIVLVANNALGALNHTLLTIEALQSRKLQIAAIVFNDTCTQEDNTNHKLIQEDNLRFLKNRFEHIPFYSLTHLQELSANNQKNQIAAWDKASLCLAPLAKQLIANFQSNDSNVQAQQNSDIVAWDIEHLWHPYTSATKPLPVYEVSHAKGMNIYLKEKNKVLIDGMSSWWCAVHGYGHKNLVQAAKEQAEKMSHIMFGGLTHAPAVHAAQKLLDLLQDTDNSNDKAKKAKNLNQLSRVFWADSGSVAVEVALKMALQYQQGRGETKRTHFLSPRGGYYGDTLGAMSVCDPINGMHTLFNHVLPKHIFIERPQCPWGNTDEKTLEASLAPLEQAFHEHAKHLAAVIIEPIVQGAGGMWFYDARYLQRVRELCTEHDVLLILDEIATGFGRTGKMFAAQWAQVQADICCAGKALTGGFMSLAATACTEAVSLEICANNQVFMHGPTFMGNALACAVAKASLDIFANTSWQEKVLRIESELKNYLAPCATLEDVHSVRTLGAIGVVEMRTQVNVATLQDFFVRRGVWIRPFAKLIYIMPPYIATNNDILTLCTAIYDAIKSGAHKL